MEVHECPSGKRKIHICIGHSTKGAGDKEKNAVLGLFEEYLDRILAVHRDSVTPFVFGLMSINKHRLVISCRYVDCGLCARQVAAGINDPGPATDCKNRHCCKS